MGRLIPACALATLSACSLSTGPKDITLAALEAAPPAPTADAARLVVADAEALRLLCTPLGPRLGLVEIHSPRQWEFLARVAPRIGRCPDLRAGTLVGIACWAGTPVDGRWPVQIEAVRVHEGAGLLKARFRGGSYLPDGTARLETAYVEGLQAVLVVDVNGTAFYPNQPD